jgi:hypothetical protein
VLRGRIGNHTTTSPHSHIRYVNLRLPSYACVPISVPQSSSNPSYKPFVPPLLREETDSLPHTRFTHDTALSPLIVSKVDGISAPCAPIVHRRPLNITCYTPSPATTAKVAISCARTSRWSVLATCGHQAQGTRSDIFMKDDRRRRCRCTSIVWPRRCVPL